MNPSADAVLNGFTSLVGALVGALVASGVAYFLQVRASKKKEHDQYLIEAHSMIFTIDQQLGSLLSIWRDLFEPHKDDVMRFLTAPSAVPRDLSKRVLDLPKMAFMLEANDGRLLLYELSHAQDAYFNALAVIIERAELLQGFRAGLDKIFDVKRDTLKLSELRDALGAFPVLNTSSATDLAYASLHAAALHLMNARLNIRPYLMKRFPKAQFSAMKIERPAWLDEEPQDLTPELREQLKR